MKHLQSIYPISGGALRFQDAVLIQRFLAQAQAPRVFFSNQHTSLYTCPNTQVSQYLGLCSIDYPLSYNPYMAQTRRSP